MERNDPHRPSVINPVDYEYVAVWTMNITGFDQAAFILQERETIKRHMARTGGTYAHVATTGSCQICGNAFAIYLELFYHAKTNSYIHVGIDCGRKLGLSGDDDRMNRFRRALSDAREAKAGKAKAQALLNDRGISEAWDLTQQLSELRDAEQKAFEAGNYAPRPKPEWARYEELTIEDIVSKVVRYGNLSDAQANYLKVLLKKIEDRPQLEAQRAAEAAAAAPVPAGRTIVTGRVLAVKTVDRPTYHYGDDGVSTKVLVQALSGYKVWGNRFNNCEKGDLVTFTATLTPSDKDPKFGFFSRAAKAFFVNPQTGEIVDHNGRDDDPEEGGSLSPAGYVS